MKTLLNTSFDYGQIWFHKKPIYNLIENSILYKVVFRKYLLTYVKKNFLILERYKKRK